MNFCLTSDDENVQNIVIAGQLFHSAHTDKSYLSMVGCLVLTNRLSASRSYSGATKISSEQKQVSGGTWDKVKLEVTDFHWVHLKKPSGSV